MKKLFYGVLVAVCLVLASGLIASRLPEETVFAANVKDVKLNKKKLKLSVGQSKKLKLKNKGKGKKVQWYSSDESVATVSGGRVYAKNPGETKIRAVYEDKYYNCVVTVTGSGSSGTAGTSDGTKAAVKPGTGVSNTVLMKDAKVGDKVVFGRYDQDNNLSNGKEEIEWLVLDKDSSGLLLISDRALETKGYNDVPEVITWEDCTLRKWLNGTFLEEAFSTSEQAAIRTTNVIAEENPLYGQGGTEGEYTYAGNNTKDKVFLLSISEAEKYFADDEARMCVPTARVIADGAWTSDVDTKGGEATCWWWLRSPGYSQGDAAGVCLGGWIYYFGFYVDCGYDCVRPALWINLNS